jgi:hypothetical protein
MGLVHPSATQSGEPAVAAPPSTPTPGKRTASEVPHIMIIDGQESADKDANDRRHLNEPLFTGTEITCVSADGLQSPKYNVAPIMMPLLGIIRVSGIFF